MLSRFYASQAVHGTNYQTNLSQLQIPNSFPLTTNDDIEIELGNEDLRVLSAVY